MNIVTARTIGSLLLLITGFSFSHYGQNKQSADGDPVIRVDTALVSIAVSIADRDGRSVSGLHQDKFRVFEDGKEQQIAYFGGNEAPFVVALLLDTSDSTMFKLADIQEAAIGFIEQLRPNDRAMVIGFDRHVNVLSGVTGDRAALIDAVHKIRVGAGTSVYNAVDTVIRQYLGPVRGRKAVVLFTDGVDTTSLEASYDSTIRLATESDSVFYTIKFDTYSDVTENARKSTFSQEQMTTTISGEPSRVVYERADRYLSLLPEITGGRPYRAGSTGYLSRAFAQIMSELRSQYLLAFYPADESKLSRRKITVKVNVSGAKVRSRKYYFFVPPAHSVKKS